MRTKSLILSIIFLTMVTVSSSLGKMAPSPKIKEDKVTYSIGDKIFKGIIVYDENQA